MLTDIKGEADSNTVFTEDFNITHTHTHKHTHTHTHTHTHKLKKTTNQKQMVAKQYAAKHYATKQPIDHWKNQRGNTKYLETNEN